MEKAALPWASHPPRRTISRLPFLAGTDTSALAGRLTLDWVPGWRPSSQSTGNQGHERIKAQRPPGATPSSRQKPTEPGPVCTRHPSRAPPPPPPGPGPLRGLQQAE